MKGRIGKIIALILILALTGGLGYIAVCGVGAEKAGSYRNISQGLDLAGGLSITYQVVGEDNPTAEDMADTIEKLRNKAETYSTEAQVYQEGGNNDRITIEIPGVSDASAILEELGRPGSLYFISQTDSEGNINYYYEISAEGNLVYMDEKYNKFYFINDTEDMAVYYDDTTGMALLDENGNTVNYDLNAFEERNISYILLKSIDQLKADGSIILDGTDVKSAKAATQDNQATGNKENVVALSLNDSGTQKFADATRNAYSKGETIAIYYDGNFISVPRVSVVITNGEAVITGMGNLTEADRLASKIRIGALKLSLEKLRDNIVGAQLGTEAVSTSIKAAAIGLALVAIIMIAVYFIPGLASVLALALYTVLIVVILSVFHDAITLTLPGIAGIILSIGMAVDANVIIFARIRDEVAKGKTLEDSVSVGFKKALSAILDGNITTLIAAFVLMFFGSGTIKGFAQTLAIGIVLSMFTALVITRLILQGFMALGITNLKLYGVAKQRKSINFLSKGHIFVIISLVLILAGFAFMGINGVRKGSPLNYSLEFVGGTSTNVELAENMTIEQIETTIKPDIEKITNDPVQIQKVEGGNEIIIKSRGLEDSERDELDTLLIDKFNAVEGSLESETISATISGEMKKESIIAVSIAVLLMLIYIWIRFSDFRFGLSSIACLLHDVLIVLAFYAVARISVGSTFIACMLTIVGYSINATIVIFDRVREELKEEKLRIESLGSRRKKKRKGEEVNPENVLDVKGIVNSAITSTLSRSIFTSLTTFVMVLLLYILGVTSIREFALPLMIGILCGTYSSVCLAGTLWVFLRKVFVPKDSDDEDELP
ncbi:MAG: protein translocase subunit SecD [Lachnospiraceae bacterium]|nr:protein translocase subunit SecD [Lachnospiraceae bacterium]